MYEIVREMVWWALVLAGASYFGFLAYHEILRIRAFKRREESERASEEVLNIILGIILKVVVQEHNEVILDRLEEEICSECSPERLTQIKKVVEERLEHCQGCKRCRKYMEQRLADLWVTIDDLLNPKNEIGAESNDPVESEHTCSCDGDCGPDCQCRQDDDDEGDD